MPGTVTHRVISSAQKFQLGKHVRGQEDRNLRPLNKQYHFLIKSMSYWWAWYY